jgi:hypothetical protein
METPPTHRNPDATSIAQPHEGETALEEVIDVCLHPDRAHHDELGHTRNGSEEAASPREQPSAPIDVSKVDE